MNVFARFMEYFWLTLAGISALWAGYNLITVGWDLGRTWIWFPTVCLAMWWYRRFTRRRMAAWEAKRPKS